MPRSSPTSAHSQARREHFVVDGSNIATEGRAMPSLTQLNEAVLAFMEEHPHALITVVVDATFGHRIDKKEVKEFDAAVANNELVTPPAGAVGRGDAFVLSIAHKAKAGILSNDSFQEFHGQYDWLFDPGRLIGGKPVPHVGWVFVERTPVRGPKSRQAVKEAKRVENGEAPAPSRRGRRGGTASGSPLANQPLPVPTAPPPGPARAATPAAAPTAPTPSAAAAAAPAPGKSTVNELVPFLDFVERHPVGTSCTAVVESYSSHGAYARADAVLVYIPLRLMDDPPPRSARSRLRLGEAVTLVVVGYAPERRSVDAALPHMAPAGAAPHPAPAAPAPRRGGAKAAKAAAAEQPAPAEQTASAAKPARRSRKAAAPAAAAEGAHAPAPVAEAPAPDSTPTSKKAPAKKAAPATKAAAKKVPAAAAKEPAAKPAPVKAAKASSRKAAAPAAADVETTTPPAPPAKKATAKKATAKPAQSTDAPEPAAPAKRSRAKKAVAAPSGGD